MRETYEVNYDNEVRSTRTKIFKYAKSNIKALPDPHLKKDEHGYYHIPPSEILLIV